MFDHLIETENKLTVNFNLVSAWGFRGVEIPEIALAQSRILRTGNLLTSFFSVIDGDIMC